MIVRIFFRVVLLLLLFPGAGYAASEVSSAPKLNISKIVWKGQFGSDEEDSKLVYLLMGSGFFRRPISNDFSHITSTWLLDHPQAYGLKVSKIDGGNGSLIFLWVTDGDESLNVHLVRNGACEARTMLPSRKSYLSAEYVSKFSAELMAAEKLAKKERQGIWADQ